MSDWLADLAALSDRAERAVLITIVEARGSTPREIGTKMIVTGARTYGTVGGGNLEHKCIELAHDRLDAQGAGAPARFIRRFPLGPSLGQCCGGVAVVMFEFIDIPQPGWIAELERLRRDRVLAVYVSRGDGSDKIVVAQESVDCHEFAGGRHQECARAVRALLDGAEEGVVQVAGRTEETTIYIESLRPRDFHIVLFGAGHVGRALVQVLSGLPCEIDWIDSRQEEFPESQPANVRLVIDENPEHLVDSAPPGSFFIVMTHSHPLDQRICERVLKRGDFAYCGLIGSLSKRRRFEKRFHAAGLSASQVKALTCPIGIGGISGKHPGAIAIAVAAELLQIREAAVATPQQRALSM